MTADQLWQASAGPYLRLALWDDENRYYAANFLMLPLSCAFGEDRAGWQQEFGAHFSKMTQAVPRIASNDTTQLSWLQYGYLLSRFLVLAETKSREALVPPGADALLRSFVKGVWLTTPAWEWGRAPFPGGMRERVLWKIGDAHGHDRHSYDRAILDVELYVFAIAADLRHYDRLAGAPPDPTLADIGRIARRTYDHDIVWRNDSAWVFQPGVWADHPDYAFAGQTATAGARVPQKRQNVSEDVSHSDRWPLWLTSEMDAATNKADSAYFRHLRAGLANEFFSKVLLAPSVGHAFPRLTNYMDGWNGLYRWRASANRGAGYGPFALSSTLSYGWWGFLDDPRGYAVFARLRDSLATHGTPAFVSYLGSNAGNAWHPAAESAETYRDAFRLLMIEAAAKRDCIEVTP